MQLYSLTIQQLTFGPDKGKYNCTAKFEDFHGREVKLVLGQIISEQILDICREEIIAAANKAASDLTNSINDAILEPPKDPIQIEQPDEAH